MIYEYFYRSFYSEKSISTRVSIFFKNSKFNKTQVSSVTEIYELKYEWLHFTFVLNFSSIAQTIFFI